MSKTRSIYVVIQLGVLLLGAVAFCVASGVSWAQEPMKVGEKYSIHVDSGGLSDVEVISTVKGLRYEISHPGATYIAIHFKKFHLAPGDALIVSDADGGQSYVLEGKGKMNAGKFWSQHVKGDTIVLELMSTGQKAGRGFVIDEYAAGFLNVGPGIERICGANDLENAICHDPSPEYDNARAVARLLIQGAWLCTGWLASASDHLITNEHCITSATEALNTDYEFMAEAPTCGSANCQMCWPGTIYSGATFIKDNAVLDYSLVQVAGNPAATYGYLEIDNRAAVVGEQIYLVSHPGGRAKEFAYTDSQDPGGVGRVISLTGQTCTGGTEEIEYWLDTEGGSSGSPVMAVLNQKVIALHHCHNYCDEPNGEPNLGVPINFICAEICGLLMCNNNGTCEEGEDCNNCPNDCFQGGAACGNGVCETANGEDCVSCSADCNGKLTGWPGRRYCCGDGSVQYGVTCADKRCTGSGNTCTADPADTSCCGDSVCEGTEDVYNCGVDCSCQTPDCSCQNLGDCNDNNECTDDKCVDGFCVNSHFPDETSCNGGLDLCCRGTCTAIVCSGPQDCDDDETCTTDTCLNPGKCNASCDYTWPECGPDDGCCGPDCTPADPDCCLTKGSSCSLDSECCSGDCNPGGRCK